MDNNVVLKAFLPVVKRLSSWTSMHQAH